MDKRVEAVKAKEGQGEDVEISIVARVGQLDLVMVKVAVEARVQIDRRH